MAARFPRADHLTNEEVDYELIIRGKREETKEELSVKHRLLRNLIFEDVRENKTYTSRYTMDQEYDYIAGKLDILSKRIQKGQDDKSISRLKHYLMRVDRCIADDPRSSQLKEELSQEINSILSRFASKDSSSKEIVNWDQTTGAVGGFEQDRESMSEKSEKSNSRNSPPKQNEVDYTNNSSGTIPKHQKPVAINPTMEENEILRQQIHMLEKQLAELRAKAQNDLGSLTGQGGNPNTVQFNKTIQRNEIPHEQSYSGNATGVERMTRDSRVSETRRNEFQNVHRIGGTRRNSYNTVNSDEEYRRQNGQSYDRGSLGFYRDVVRNQPRYDAYEQENMRDQEVNPNQVRRNSGIFLEPGLRQGRVQSGRNEFRHNASYVDEEDYNELPQYQVRRPISEIEIVNADRRMEKWHLTFNGDSRQRSLEDFLHKVRRLARMDRIEGDVLLQRIHTILRGEAYDWYLCYSDEFMNWDDFEARIRYMYGNPNKDQGNRQRIYERKQQRNETFLSFKMEIERLNKLLSTPLDQDRLFEIIWDNMRPHYRSKLACINVRDLHMLEYYAYRIDANDSSFRQRELPPRTTNTVHNIEATNESENSYSSCSEAEEVNEVGRKFDKTKRAPGRFVTNQQPRGARETAEDQNIPLCWNCNKTGHLWRYCKEPRRIFCYSCGNPGKTTVSCPNHVRDTQQSVQRSGN